MLNSILKKLNGHAIDVESLATALLQIGSERDEAVAQIADLKERKHQLLLDDGSDSDLDKIERQIDRAETRLEKINLAEPGIRDRLTAAKAEAHKVAVSRHLDLMAKAYETLRAAVLAAESAQVGLMRARDTAVREVGEHSLSCLPIFAYGGILGHSTAQLWAAENDRILAAAVASRQPRPAEKKAAAKMPVPASTWWDPKDPGYHHPAAQQMRDRTKRPVNAGLQHPIELVGGGVSRAAVELAPHDFEPLMFGQARVRVLRGGYSPADDRPQCHFGQVIRMGDRTALAAASAGVVEIIESFGDQGPSAAHPNKTVGVSAEGAGK